MVNMNNFELALEKVLQYEGGYTNHINDNGGETNFGITENVARDFGYSGDMRNLTLDIVKEIYHKKYWLTLKLNNISSYYISSYVFDMGVLHGIKRAGIIFQTAINFMSQIKIDVDGVIGNKTLQAYEPLKKDLLLKHMKGLRYEFVHSLIENNPSQQIFFNGWVNRIME